MSQDLFSDSQLVASQESALEDGVAGGQNEELEPPFSQLTASDITHIKNSSKDELLRVLLPKDLISKHKHVFIQLQKKTKEAEDVSDISRSSKLLSEQIEKQDKYYRSGGVNDNMCEDAKCISINTGITHQLVKRLQTDTNLFDPMEFAEKLLSVVNPFQVNATADESTSDGVDTNDWIEFGRTHCRFQRILPKLNFMNGSFDPTIDSVQRQPQKQHKPRERQSLSAQTQATQLDPNLKQTEDFAPQEVEHILKTLKKLEVKNPEVSLPYIEVMVNPDSISQTVENIFHSSFLIKDGLARITVEESGMPAIASIDNSNIHLSQPESGIQSVLSFSMNDWKSWVQKFELTKPVIKHQKKKPDKINN